jgi:CBS domain-containing protein
VASVLYQEFNGAGRYDDGFRHSAAADDARYLLALLAFSGCKAWLQAMASAFGPAQACGAKLSRLHVVELPGSPIFGGAGFGGLWMAFIGWFLWDAARASYAQVEVVEGLRGVRVRDVMSRDCPSVEGHMTLQTFADVHLLRTGRRCFVVVEDGSIAGLITPHEVKDIPRALWPKTTIAEAMRPLAQLRTIRSDTPVAEALETMGCEDVNPLPVSANGHLEGVISRGHIVGFLRMRAELSM